MKKSKISQSVKKKLITKLNRILLVTTLITFVLMLGTPFLFNSNSITKGVPITGLAIGDEPNNSIPATDITVWQGQYFIGTEFQTGTYKFNFTVYDDKVGGGHATLIQPL